MGNRRCEPQVPGDTEEVCVCVYNLLHEASNLAKSSLGKLLGGVASQSSPQR